MNVRITDESGRVHLVEMVLGRTARNTALNIAKRCFVRPGSKIEWWELKFEDVKGAPKLARRQAYVDGCHEVWLYDAGSGESRVVGCVKDKQN